MLVNYGNMTIVDLVIVHVVVTDRSNVFLKHANKIYPVQIQYLKKDNAVLFVFRQQLLLLFAFSIMFNIGQVNIGMLVNVTVLNVHMARLFVININVHHYLVYILLLLRVIVVRFVGINLVKIDVRN